MRTARVYFAGVLLGVSLVTAVWLYTYRVWSVYEWIGSDGRTFHPSERMLVSPWWSVPATVVVVLAGLAASFWLLPTRRGLMQRLADHFISLSPSRR